MKKLSWMLAAATVAVFGCSPANPPADTVGADASDSAAPPAEAGVCMNDQVVTSFVNMETGCMGFRATPCAGATTPFCPHFVANDAMHPKFMFTQIDISVPSTLASTTAVGRLLNTSIRNAAFAWGVDADLSMTPPRVRTGTLAQTIAVREGTGYYNEMVRFVTDAAPMPGMTNRWNPVSVEATLMGETLSTVTTPLITIPVFDEAVRTNLLTELPLRNARIRDLRMTGNRNCIGTAQNDFNSCGPNNNRWNTAEGGTPNGVLEADLTVADAIRIQVVSLMMPLCTIIAGSACTTGGTDGGTGTMTDPTSWRVPPDAMVDGQPAWHLVANVAGVSANIAP